MSAVATQNEAKRQRRLAKVQAMTNAQLEEEWECQNEYEGMDSHEYANFGRGDNGFDRAGYLVIIYDEMVNRGLRQPIKGDAVVHE
jgi:hypothetical protein